jgi:hypothetical protein
VPLLAALALALMAARPASAVDLQDQVTTGDPLANTVCTVPATKTFFRPTDATAFLWILFGGATEGDVAEWRWFAPDGSPYVTSNFEIPFDGDGCTWSGINIAGQAAADLPGEWRVDFYFNDAFVTTARFTIDTVPPPGPGAAHIDLAANDQSLVPWGYVHLSYRIQSFRAGLAVDLYVATVPTDGQQCVSPELVFTTTLTPHAANLALANTQGVIASGYLPASVGARTETLYAVLVQAGRSPADADNFVSNVAALDLVFSNLSSAQAAVISAQGNPDGYVIGFDHERRQRIETWRYQGGELGGHFQFLNGGVVGDPPTAERSSAGAGGGRPVGLGPGALSPATTPTDLRNLLGDPDRVVRPKAGRVVWIFESAGATVTLDDGIIRQIQVR